MANTASLVRLQRVLTNAAGTVYANASVYVLDQDARTPMRLYSDAAAANMTSNLGQTTTDATGKVDVYVAAKKTVELQVRDAAGTLLQTYSDVSPGDPQDLGEVAQTLIAGRITTAQAAVAVNTDLVLNSTGGGNLALDPATGIFTLKAGRTYLIMFSLGFSTFSNTTAGVLTVEVVGGTSNTALVAGKAATCIPTSNTAAANNNSTASFLYTATADTTAKLRCTAATGTAQLEVGLSSLTVVSL